MGSVLGSFASSDSERALVLGRDRAATRGEVDAFARSLSRLIARTGFLKGAAVALQCPNGPAYLAACMALWRTGHPVLLLDDSTPPLERQRIGTDLGATGTLVTLDGWNASAHDFRWELLEDGPPLPDAAVVKLTSGTTGKQRGIAVPESALLADTRALWRTMRLQPDERILGALPWSHSYGFSTVVMPALIGNCTLICPDGDEPLSAAARDGATFLPTAPAYLQAVVQRSSAMRLPASLRCVISAGAPLGAEIARVFRERFGRPAHTFYGASEAGGITFDRRGDAAERGTVGAPIDGVKIEIDDCVVVRSPAVADRYVPHSDAALSSGCYRSNDRAEWHDGELVLKGRATHLINLDGRQVCPEHVRRVLLALDGVEDAIVFGRTDPRSEKQSIQALVAVPNATIGYRDVRAWCRLRLPAYQVPRGITIVPEIPYNTRGKPDLDAARRELR